MTFTFPNIIIVRALSSSSIIIRGVVVVVVGNGVSRRDEANARRRTSSAAARETLLFSSFSSSSSSSSSFFFSNDDDDDDDSFSFMTPLRAGRVVVFSRRREPTTPSGIYMCYSSKRVVLVERRYFSTPPFVKVCICALEKQKVYTKERDVTPKHFC